MKSQPKKSVFLSDRPAEVRLSPTAARIVDLLAHHGESYGVGIAKALDDVELGTVYVLLKRLEDKGVLQSRVEEAEMASGRRVIRRYYRLTSALRRKRYDPPIVDSGAPAPILATV